MTSLGQLRFPPFDVRDAIEIAIAAYVLYRLLLLVRGTRALQMLLVIVSLVVVYALAYAAKLTMLTFLLGLLFQYGAFGAIVVFQPELRAALSHFALARSSPVLPRLEDSEVADEIADAVERLARNGTGALIAIERDSALGDYVESGSPMQAKLSADLLTTIFTPYSPLHDGAVVIRGDTIIGAGCILPLSQGPVADRSLGTRHRAALGLTEETDAFVVVVSEESATISLAVSGKLLRGLAPVQVRDLLSGKPGRATAEFPAVALPT